MIYTSLLHLLRLIYNLQQRSYGWCSPSLLDGSFCPFRVYCLYGIWDNPELFGLLVLISETQKQLLFKCALSSKYIWPTTAAAGHLILDEAKIRFRAGAASLHIHLEDYQIHPFWSISYYVWVLILASNRNSICISETKERQIPLK